MTTAPEADPDEERRAKQREYARRSYWKNREKRLERQRAWRNANPEKSREASDRWKAENPEKVQAYRRTEEEKAKARERARRYRGKNPDYAREYRERNRDRIYIRDLERNRRRLTENQARTDEEVAVDQARLRSTGVKWCRNCEQDLPFEAYNLNRPMDDGLYALCRACAKEKRDARLMRRAKKHAEELSLNPKLCAYCRAAPATDCDHITPVADDGQDDELNLLPACKPCNSSKHVRPLEVWLPRRLADLGQPLDWADQLVALLARENLALKSDKARLRRQRAQQQRDAETLF